MATKDITDIQVLRAYAIAGLRHPLRRWPYEILADMTGQPIKVCYRAMERASRRRLIDYGVSLRTGWLTDKGRALLEEHLEKIRAKDS